MTKHIKICGRTEEVAGTAVPVVIHRCLQLEGHKRKCQCWCGRDIKENKDGGDRA